MNPEQKQAVIEALQETIEDIKKMKDGQKIGLLLSVGIQQPDKGEDVYENTKILVGYSSVIAHNLAKSIRTGEDYAGLFHRTLNML